MLKGPSIVRRVTGPGPMLLYASSKSPSDGDTVGFFAFFAYLLLVGGLWLGGQRAHRWCKGGSPAAVGERTCTASRGGVQMSKNDRMPKLKDLSMRNGNLLSKLKNSYWRKSCKGLKSGGWLVGQGVQPHFSWSPVTFSSHRVCTWELHHCIPCIISCTLTRKPSKIPKIYGSSGAPLALDPPKPPWQVISWGPWPPASTTNPCNTLTAYDHAYKDMDVSKGLYGIHGSTAGLYGRGCLRTPPV